MYIKVFALNPFSNHPKSLLKSPFSGLSVNLLIILMARISLIYSCNVDMCSREYSSVLEVSQPVDSHSIQKGQQYCQLLNAYQHCLRSIGRSCRGNLEFHTLQTLLKNWKHDNNCSQSSTQSSLNPQHKQTVATPQRRSGQSLVNSQNSHSSHQSNHKILQQQERLQLCLSSAYNFTINSNNITNISSRVRDERIKLLNSEEKSEMRSGSGRKRDPMKLRHRAGRNADVSEIPVKTNYFPIRGETVEFDDNNEDKSELNTNMPSLMSTTGPTVRPSVPPSPPLTCIIYGDPHLRTFNNEYQTCRCLGAWPLIDHPLFAVQITNSRIKGSSPQITGVTKVTVLVRQFGRCGIHNDLLYEADSTANQVGQTSSSPSSTFIDGSTSNSNNLIRITTSSNNNVITIHLDHIGVRVYIGQFESSNYLNVVIKFRSATSTVKQQLVLNSISSNSLCKIGCPHRELIDIKNILTATGVDIKSKNTDIDNDNDVNDYKSDTTVVDTHDESVVDEEEVVEDPCSELYGYYRISCLYDMTIKGVKHVNNACRFAQSFDDLKFVQNSILNSVNSNQNDVKIIANSSSNLTFNHSFTIFLVFVISLFCSYISKSL